MAPQEGLQLVESILGQDQAAYQTFAEIGPRVFWSPYILKRLTRLGVRQDWSDLEAQFRRTMVDAKLAPEMQWQKVLETFHEMWMRSLGVAASLVQPWANAPWFSSFGLNAVQAIYQVDREMTVERLGILLLYGLIQQIEKTELSESRYRWDPLMWNFIRRRFRSLANADFNWVAHLSGGWGQTPLWQISVPGRSIWELQPWRLHMWGPGIKTSGLIGVRRWIIWRYSHPLHPGAFLLPYPLQFATRNSQLCEIGAGKFAQNGRKEYTYKKPRCFHKKPEAVTKAGEPPRCRHNTQSLSPDKPFAVKQAARLPSSKKRFGGPFL